MKKKNIIRRPIHRIKWMEPNNGKHRGEPDQPNQLAVFPVPWRDGRKEQASETLATPTELNRDADGFYKLERKVNNG